MHLPDILALARSRGASDVFLTSGSAPSMKLNGAVVPVPGYATPLTREEAEVLLLQSLSEKQKGLFEKSLEIDYALTLPGQGTYRVNAFVHYDGVGAVYRIIPSDIPDYASLGLPPAVLDRVLSLKKGLVLITGPMGSGKTTTLAAMVDEINKTQQRHIVTIEEPIEYLHSSQKSLIEQREVGIHTQSFSHALRSGLRQAADVIMLGELRDLDTISLALRAAETGSLVLGTLHTSGAARSIHRIIDVFPGGSKEQIRSMLSTSLSAVVWQQLLPAAGGGRVAAAEVLFTSTAIAQLIRTDKVHQIPGVIETSTREGMQTMKQALGSLREQGRITQAVYDEYIVALELTVD